MINESRKEIMELRKKWEQDMRDKIEVIHKQADEIEKLKKAVDLARADEQDVNDFACRLDGELHAAQKKIALLKRSVRVLRMPRCNCRKGSTRRCE